MRVYNLPEHVAEYHLANLRSVARPVSSPVVSVVNHNSYVPRTVAPIVKSVTPVNTHTGTVSRFVPHVFSHAVARPTARLAVSKPVSVAATPAVTQQSSPTVSSLAPISGLTLPSVVNQAADTVVPVPASSSTSSKSATQLFNDYLSQMQAMTTNQNSGGQSSTQQSSVSATSLSAGSTPNIDSLQNNNLSPDLNFSVQPFTAPTDFQQFAVKL